MYSLGVILFELLTGRRPSEERGRRTQDRFGLDTGRGRPSSTVVRPLRAAEGDEEATCSAEEIAARRGTTPERLRLRLRGDLDTITLKALADEPERRYHSAEQLLADVRRFRRGLPVLARGESFGYRTTKFVRRHRVVVSLSAALAVLVLGFVGTTFRQNQLLRQARASIDVRQGQAENLITYMLGDLSPKLASIAKSDLILEAAKQAEEYFMAVPAEQLTDEELRRRTEQMRVLAKVRMDRGDEAAARRNYQEAYSLSLSLLQRDSTNPAWRLGLATDHFWLGSMSFSAGELEQALEHFEAYRDNVARLLAEEPASPLYRLEMSYALGSIGTVREYLGDREGALREFLRTLELKQELVAQDPDDPELQTALAIAYNKVAVAEQQRGNLAAALEHHRAELGVRQALVDRDPADMPARSDLSRTHSYLGEILLGMGETADALDHWMDSWRIQQDLVRWDSANVGWQRGLATSARLAGRGLVAAGREEEGLAAIEGSREILRRLLDRNPESVDYRQELAETEAALANVLVQGQPAGAEAAARRSLQVLAPIATDVDRPPLVRRIESGAYLQLGRALAGEGREAEARAAWGEALAVLGLSDEGTSHLAARAYALLYLGRRDEAREAVDALLAQGYRSPDFVALARRSGVLPAAGR